MARDALCDVHLDPSALGCPLRIRRRVFHPSGLSWESRAWARSNLRVSSMLRNIRTSFTLALHIPLAFLSLLSSASGCLLRCPTRPFRPGMPFKNSTKHLPSQRAIVGEPWLGYHQPSGLLYAYRKVSAGLSMSSGAQQRPLVGEA